MPLVSLGGGCRVKVKAPLFHSKGPEKGPFSTLEAHSPGHTPQCQGPLKLADDQDACSFFHSVPLFEAG